MNVGKNIRKLRKDRELDQETFAGRIGVTQPYLSQLENSRRDPSMSLLRRISEELEVSVPGLILLSMEEEDVQKDRREAFEDLRPEIEKLILGELAKNAPDE
jgi:transcriptional regulator with XRE-family HTH domain